MNRPASKRPVVVSDSGPLIALAGCGHLELLSAVFDQIHVPRVVLDETTADRSRPGADGIAAFVQAHARVHPRRDDARYTAAVSHHVLDEARSFRVKRLRLLEIDDVDLVSFAEDVLCHLRVPEAGLMSEMNTRFQHLSH